MWHRLASIELSLLRVEPASVVCCRAPAPMYDDAAASRRGECDEPAPDSHRPDVGGSDV